MSVVAAKLQSTGATPSPVRVRFPDGTDCPGSPSVRVPLSLYGGHSACYYRLQGLYVPYEEGLTPLFEACIPADLLEGHGPLAAYVKGKWSLLLVREGHEVEDRATMLRVQPDFVEAITPGGVFQDDLAVELTRMTKCLVFAAGRMGNTDDLLAWLSQPGREPVSV
jgi:hypothetical protein